MSIVFDPNVFDVAIFDALYAVPTLYKVTVETEFRKVKIGQTVATVVSICTTTVTAFRKFLINTDSTPQMQIYNPDGSVHTAYTNMINMGVGIYMHRWTPTAVGAYSAQFTAVNGPYTLITAKMVICEVS